MITKEDVNKLLAHFRQDEWINEEEETEIREYLFVLKDKDELNGLMLEACFADDWAICAPSYLWSCLEEIQKENEKEN